MDYVAYGDTGLTVSRLCIGTGHFKNVFENFEAGGEFLVKVLDRGVTFWDTAEGYGSHPHIGEAFRRIDRSKVVLQSKLGQKDYDTTKEHLDQALRDLGTDYLDILLLHGVNSPRDLNEREGALRAMLEAKQAGKVRVVGCSTHIYTGPVMDTVTDCDEMEVILCTVNKGGIMLEGSIVDPAEGTPRVPAEAKMDEHTPLVQRAYEKGKGISIMKIIGQRKAPEAEWPDWIRWGFEFPFAHAVNLGICNEPELDLDVTIEGEVAATRRMRKAA